MTLNHRKNFCAVDGRLVSAWKKSTRRTDDNHDNHDNHHNHDNQSETTNPRKISNLFVQRHKICDHGVKEAKAQALRQSACSVSGVVRRKHEKGGGATDPDHDLDQYSEIK